MGWYARRSWIRAGAFAVTILAIIGTFILNQYLGFSNAQPIIDAVDAYRQQVGHYPQDLVQLTPKYLDHLPRCCFRMIMNEYKYLSSGRGHWIEWVAWPPFGRYFFDFESRLWTFLD